MLEHCLTSCSILWPSVISVSCHTTMILLLFAVRILLTEAQPLCTYAYSPCDPQDVNIGVCMDAPGETCYADQNNIVYCCVPEPTTAGPPTTAAPNPGGGGPAAPSPSCTTTPPTFTGKCEDVLSCCMTRLCSQYRNEMMRLCPATCGFCTPTATSPPISLTQCSDSFTSCGSQASLCKNAQYSATMKQQCTYTCGYCLSCVDNSNSCATWAKNGFCTNSYYTVDQIRSFCARTCGYCANGPLAAAPAPPPAPAPCVDSTTSCVTWAKNGFCSNSYYTAAQKKQYCAKSCYYC